MKLWVTAILCGIAAAQNTTHQHATASPSIPLQPLAQQVRQLEEAMNSGGAEVHRKTAAAESLHQIAETIHKRSLVIIFSDMMDNTGDTNDLFNALQHLKYNKHEVILFHVNDKKLELDFKFDNRPYQFIDVETGEKVKVHSNQVRDIYLEKMNKFHHELKIRCAQYKIDFIEADIHEGYQQVLMPYLIKRQKMN